MKINIEKQLKKLKIDSSSLFHSKKNYKKQGLSKQEIINIEQDILKSFWKKVPPYSIVKKRCYVNPKTDIKIPPKRILKKFAIILPNETNADEFPICFYFPKTKQTIYGDTQNFFLVDEDETPNEIIQLRNQLKK